MAPKKDAKGGGAKDKGGKSAKGGADAADKGNFHLLRTFLLLHTSMNDLLSNKFCIKKCTHRSSRQREERWKFSESATHSVRKTG